LEKKCVKSTQVVPELQELAPELFQSCFKAELRNDCGAVIKLRNDSKVVMELKKKCATSLKLVRHQAKKKQMWHTRTTLCNTGSVAG
jgi:hypothetical protein